MTALTTGVHLQQATVCHLLGIPAPHHPQVFPAAAVRFLTAPPMQIERITGVDSARTLPGIVRVDLDVQPGQEVRPLASSDERLGYVLGGGASLEDAVTCVQGAAEQIQVEGSVLAHLGLT
ncbi:hypothetical protein [Deinococcus sp.]|uniref:hypothetical protein n=1 Tax=Deinococcus sp. TaxID=47478 RepID=UPI0025C3A555|nr:hypothetical protein [Deinococcus sp.]